MNGYRFSLLWCSVVTLVLATASEIQSAQPNILLILADDMGYGDLGCYGSQQIETPVLDRLAAEGIRCTQGYVAASVCAPSRAGLLTGRYPQRIGFEHNLTSNQPTIVPEQLGIRLDHRTLGDYLREAGYRTGIVGKWHVGEVVDAFHPNQRGFEFFFGMLNGSHNYFPTLEKNRLEFNGEPIDAVRTPYLTDWLTDEAIDFVQHETSQPWFLLLSYNTPHTPLQAKQSDLARFEHIPHQGRRTYAAMQWSMDQNIGRLLDQLRVSGQFENTLLVFFSDNGGSVSASHACNAPLFGMKGTFYEGGIRVPFLFSWPLGLPREIVYDRPLISLDLLPTFLAAAGAEMPVEWEGTGRNRHRRTFDGVNLLPFLRGNNADRPHETLFWRMSLRAMAVRHGDWKLHLPIHQLPILTNLKHDVSEQQNRFAEFPDKATELLTLLNTWQESLNDTPHWHEQVYWQGYNRRLHERDYRLTQPERDEDYSGAP